MTQVDTTRAEKPERKSPTLSWLVAVSALVVIGLVALLMSQSSNGLATPPSLTAEQVAEKFVGGLEALDSDVVDGLVSAEATSPYLDTFGYDETQPGSISRLWEWGAIYHMSYSFSDGCRSSNRTGGPPLQTDQGFYTCDYRLENDWTRALGQAPMSGRFRMEVSDGQIVWLVEDFPFGELQAAWGAVIQWVRATHPEDFETMFLDGLPGAGLAESARLTPESMALWKEYTPAMLESLSG